MEPGAACAPKTTMPASLHPTKTPLPAGPLIELRRVSKLYGSFVALRDVSLSLAAGSSSVLIGPNGAGKSTLLKLIAGLTRPTFGEVLVFAQTPGAVRGRVAYMGHSTMLYDELTAPENLRYLLGLERPQLSHGEREAHVAAALEEVGLDPAITRRVGEYSQGMRQRAALARVLLSSPDLLLLDEPFSNLDVSSVATMIARLQRYLATPGPDGGAPTLLLTTHQVELARELVQQTLTLRAGRLEVPPMGRADVATAPAMAGQLA
jgi:ABC-type multidrug transport system ATPase subunit